MNLSSLILIALGSAAYVNFLRSTGGFSGRAYEHTSKDIRADINAAMSYEKAGMHDEAIDVYYRMLEQDPDNPGIYVNLAAIQVTKGNFEKAAELCEKAIALEPKNATAHNNLAVAYYTLGKHDLAIEHCDLAVKYGYKVKPELIKLLQPYRE